MNKLALVTGGATRIGAAITAHLAQQGREVIIHYNNSAKEAQALSESLQTTYKGKTFPIVQYDLFNWKKIDGFWNDVVQQYGVPELLVNNASLFHPGRIADTSTELMESMLNVNFMAPFYMTQAFSRTATNGDVINLLDTAITTNATTHVAYLLAKKNLGEFTKMAALEWAPEIRVNAIAPGPVLPPPDKSIDHLNAVALKTPLQRIVEVKALLSALDYLLTNKSVTGDILFCDSGQHLL
ncbi:MAG: SDR family oxidoreductase [Marinilabiliaceae bacterium]|nr:SDR family oxidoreductase [Marinilabiliaceae bacterium]